MATPPDFSPGQVLTAAHMDAVGLWLVGSNTATSGSSCDVVGCFSADFDGYRVIITNVKTAAAADMAVTLLANTTPAASNWTWASARLDYAASAWNVSKGTGAAAANFTIVGTNASGAHLDVFNPFLSQYSTVTGGGVDPRGTIGYLPITSGGQLANTTSYDGIRIQTTSTFSSISVKVYGYRN